MNKNLPLIIIAIVLVAAVVGGYALFNQNPAPKPPANNAQDKPDTFKAMLDKAPQGASPVRFKGDPKAVVTIEEFADFACPTCAQFHLNLKEIERSYGSKVRIIFRHFPLMKVKGHENAYDAARAAEAAGAQDRFWEMQNMLFSNQKVWQLQSEADARKTFEDYAKSIGLDTQRFTNDMLNGQSVSGRISDDMKRAQALGVNSTPTVIVNGRPPLTYNEIATAQGLRQVIETELQKAQAAAPSGGNSANQNTP